MSKGPYTTVESRVTVEVFPRAGLVRLEIMNVKDMRLSTILDLDPGSANTIAIKMLNAASIANEQKEHPMGEGGAE